MLVRRWFSILIGAVSAPGDRHEDGHEAASVRTDEDRRAHTLLRLMAPLVHRLNNSLAVVQGVHESGSQAHESERELADRELAVVGHVLARLAILSRPSAARSQFVELGELFRTHELLLAPLAESLEVELELR